MHRQFESLLLASKANVQARKLCEEAFGKLKVDVGVVVGSIYVCEAENDQQASTGNQIIRDPKGSRRKSKECKEKKYIGEDVKHCKIKEDKVLLKEWRRCITISS